MAEPIPKGESLLRNERCDACATLQQAVIQIVFYAGRLAGGLYFM